MTELCPVCHRPLPMSLRNPRRLTPRENEVCALLAEGMGDKAISAKLDIEIGTVKNHVHNILKKMGVESRHQAGHLYANRYQTTEGKTGK